MKAKLILLAGAIILTVLSCGCSAEQSSPESSESSASSESYAESSQDISNIETNDKDYNTYDYNTLKHNLKKYAGEKIKFYGEIKHQYEGTLLINMTPEKDSKSDSGFSWSDIVYVTTKDNNPVEGDIVKVCGTIKQGITTYSGAAFDFNIEADSIEPVTDYSVITAKEIKTSDAKYEIADTYFNTNDVKKSSDGWYDIDCTAWVAIKNTDTRNIYIDDCVFDIVGNEDETILSIYNWGILNGGVDYLNDIHANSKYISICERVLKPGEIGYCSLNVYVSANVQELDKYNLSMKPEIKVSVTADDDIIYHTVTDSKLTDDYSIKGTVTNSQSDTENINIHYQLFDADGKFLWSDYATIEGVAANATQDFSIAATIPVSILNDRKPASLKCTAVSYR